jgi:hypothetical protein
MGSLPSATTTECCVERLIGAFLELAQNNPTRAKTVSMTSTALFMGGTLSGWILMRAEVYAPL